MSKPSIQVARKLRMRRQVENRTATDHPAPVSTVQAVQVAKCDFCGEPAGKPHADGCGSTGPVGNEAASRRTTGDALDALKSIRDVAAFDKSASGAIYYAKAENTLAAIEGRDAVAAPASPPDGAMPEQTTCVFPGAENLPLCVGTCAKRGRCDEQPAEGSAQVAMPELTKMPESELQKVLLDAAIHPNEPYVRAASRAVEDKLLSRFRDALDAGTLPLPMVLPERSDTPALEETRELIEAAERMMQWCVKNVNKWSFSQWDDLDRAVSRLKARIDGDNQGAAEGASK